MSSRVSVDNLIFVTAGSVRYCIVAKLIKRTAHVHRLQALKMVTQEFLINAARQTSNIGTTKDSNATRVDILDYVPHVQIRQSGFLDIVS